MRRIKQTATGFALLWLIVTCLFTLVAIANGQVLGNRVAMIAYSDIKVILVLNIIGLFMAFYLTARAAAYHFTH